MGGSCVLTLIQVDYYLRAIKLDQFLAVCHFQQGVSNFLMGDFEKALTNFNDTLYYLRGNNSINYEQLGLKFKLFSCEVLFNRGLCYIYLQQLKPGMQDLIHAAKEKVVPNHDAIDEAIREQAEVRRISQPSPLPPPLLAKLTISRATPSSRYP